MRTILIAVLTLFTITLNAQEMEEIRLVESTITKLFVNTDERNWDGVEAQFASKVLLDYESMSGNPAVELAPSDITFAWKGVLPGFDSTHHQLGNFNTEINGDSAKSFCYGTATHYLENEHGSIWTVLGSYNFELQKMDGNWKVTSMKFNFKYQDGNTTLVDHAIENLKNDKSETLSNKENVSAFFKALEDENVDALVELFDANGKHINPYHSNLFPKGATGQEEIRNYWTPVFPNFDGMEFIIDEILDMEGNSVFVKYTGNIKLKNGAGVYSNEYYSTFKFNSEGKIIEYVEIFNPIVAAKGFGLLDQIK